MYDESTWMRVLAIWECQYANNEEEEDQTAEAAPDVCLRNRVAPAAETRMISGESTMTAYHTKKMRWMICRQMYTTGVTILSTRFYSITSTNS